jgi:Tol biopolymer transport system component
MLELREVFEMVTKQTEPDLDSWKKQEDRQRRASRNRKVGVVALVAVFAIGLLLFALSARPGKDSMPLGSVTPSVPIPAFGAQIVGLDGTVLAGIPGLPADAYGLQLSPDGTTVAFMTEGASLGDGRVATIKVDGTDLQILTGNTNNTGDAQDAVSWSPDGSQIAYAANGDIYTMDADGSNVRQLTTDPSGDYHPDWSSRGTIVYWHGAPTGEDGGPADTDIYTIPASGGTPTLVTLHYHDLRAIEPTWSPDGTKIAYYLSSREEIWVMRADGTHAQRVYAGKDNAGWAPAWSPDATKIAFLRCCVSDGGTTLLTVQVLDLDTRDVRDLKVHVATDLNGPTWASDSTLLVNRYS